MLKIVDGSGDLIVGSKIGDTLSIYLISGKIEKVILDGIKRVGIEGFNMDLTSKPLTFYPYTSIMKVTKFTEIT